MEIPCKILLSFLGFSIFCMLPALLFVQAAVQTIFKFDFDSAAATKGYQKVTTDDLFTNAKDYITKYLIDAPSHPDEVNTFSLLQSPAWSNVKPCR